MRTELVAGALLLSACEGGLVEVMQQPGQDQAQTVLADGGISKPPTPKPTDPEACEPRASARLALLSDLQQLTAVRAMLGDDALTGDDLPSPQLKPFMNKGTVVNTSLVHTRNEWARMASEAKPPKDCTDAACAATFLRSFASRAFRRPVEDEEVSDLMTVYTLAAQEGPAHGIQRAVEAVLAAPSFAYRRELGSTDKSGLRALDAYELASVVSFALTDGPPDDALWKVASDGTLTDAKVLRAQLDRLLADSKVQQTITGTLLAAWGLGNIFGASKDPTLFPSFGPQLMASMYHETELMVSDVLWSRKAPINELLSTAHTFVDSALAQLYGISAPKTAFSAVDLPAAQRAGLLTQASVLTMLARSDTTSVVARGLFVRGLMCMQKVPSPPESLTAQVNDLLKQDMTERERAQVRAKNPTCGACHAGIDPYGLLLEKYDALGRFRPAEDTHVSIANSGDFDDALAFARDAAMEEDFGNCVATRVLSYALQDDALTPRDCQVQEALAGATMEVLTMTDLVQRMLTSPSLSHRQEAP